MDNKALASAPGSETGDLGQEVGELSGPAEHRPVPRADVEVLNGPSLGQLRHLAPLDPLLGLAGRKLRADQGDRHVETSVVTEAHYAFGHSRWDRDGS